MQKVDSRDRGESEDSPSFGNASTMPVTGACCGIRPSEKAMATEFTVDFSKAKDLLPSEQDKITK
ncbi:hypothetical protein [Bermanella sp. R86510]|uniref:hypothetical protein n=1 Tax=unclassified Bermanella TaxID=2627862 RepID=UPI0037C9C25F